MRETSLVNKYRCALSVPCLALLFACNPVKDDGASADVGHRAQAIGNYARLTATEWTNYQADRKYVHSLVGPNTPIRLNYADQRQYRFAMARLKIAGKNAENSPYLFELIEKRRQEHVRAGHSDGLLPGALYATLETGERTELHDIERASMGGLEGEEAGSAAASTVPGGSYFTLVDIDYIDVGGQPLADYKYVEEFDLGLNTVIATEADLSLSNLSRYAASSYKLEDRPDGFVDSYLYEEFGSDDAAEPLGAFELSAPASTHPVDFLPAGAPNNLIKICLERSWGTDCEYDMIGMHQAKIPMKGSVTIKSGHELDTARIDAIKGAFERGETPTTGGDDLRLVLETVGGKCDVIDGDTDTLVADIGQFWKNVSYSGDKKTFSWDLTGENIAVFDESCQLNRVDVKLTLKFTVYMVDPNDYDRKLRETITLSNDPRILEVLRQPPHYAPIAIRNSCLAAGTLIEIGGGKAAPIESLAAGATVMNPYHRPNSALTIVDTAVGTESTPMVRITDDAGRVLLMTEMHTIQTPDRGMVQARLLQEGDRVVSKDGVSTLTEVTRESYDGQVYNLKLGSESEMAALGEDQTVMYANGFMVGDGRIQDRHEALAMSRDEGDILERLPVKWHRDYLLSGQAN